MSVPFGLQEALDWTDGRLLRGDAVGPSITGVSINTRTLRPGDLFIAIRGANHDAHAFIGTALEAGASALVVEEAWVAEQAVPGDVPAVAVADGKGALGALARGHRRGFDGPVVAITGSNGKTTTKEICHAIYSVKCRTLKNEGNLNNEFGLPLTLLAREPEQRAAVVEMGMNHRHEIARLAAIAEPTVGVVTNVGTAHIEHLGTREEIALEKTDLIAALPPEGIAVINADDPRIMMHAGRARCRVLRFGLGANADVRAEDVRFERGGRFAFRLCTPEGERPVHIAGLAETTVINALAAAAAALAGGVDVDAVADGLGRFGHVPGRMACQTLSGGAQLIDDTYNANPQSMRSAIETLARLKGPGRGFAVLGGMGELGESADEAHRDAGRQVAESGVDHLFVVGETGRGIAEGAIEAGMAREQVHRHDAPEEAAGAIEALLGDEDWVLVKGSRAMRMERVVHALIAARGAAPGAPQGSGSRETK